MMPHLFGPVLVALFLTASGGMLPRFIASVGVLRLQEALDLY